MREQLIGKTTEEKVSLKAEEIVRVTEKKQYERKDVKLEIVDTAKTQGGVEVFARAWRDGQQIGFGKDGTVDIERLGGLIPVLRF